LRDDLRAFAREALDEHDLNAQLFATEADKAMRLLDVLMGEYDVVVMNPPYGGTTGMAKEYLKTTYPLTKNDIYAAFFERAIDFLSRGGYAGALTSRTFFNLRSFQKLREEILLLSSPLVTVLDLGFGILDDAMVETAATVVAKGHRPSEQLVCPVIRLNTFDKELEYHLKQILRQPEDLLLLMSLEEMRNLPGAPLAYWAPSSLVARFSSLPSFSAIGRVCLGLGTRNDTRFVRNWWELSKDTLAGLWPFRSNNKLSLARKTG